MTQRPLNAMVELHQVLKELGLGKPENHDTITFKVSNCLYEEPKEVRLEYRQGMSDPLGGWYVMEEFA